MRQPFPRGGLWLCLGIALIAGLAYATTGRGERLPSVAVYPRIFQATVPGAAEPSSGRARTFTPAEVAALGGDVDTYAVHTGVPLTAIWNQSNREKILEAKRIAAEQGIPIRFYLSARPDTYIEHAQWGVTPGFQDAWLMRTPRSQYEQDVERFAAAGWSVDFASWMSPGFVSRIMDDPESAPCLYGFRKPKHKQLRVTDVLADVRNPEYRAWHIAWVRELLAHTGAEGVVVAVKTGFHANPQHYLRAGPKTRWGGPLSPTPYGPGEFEAAMGAYLKELASHGIPIVTEERPPGRGGFGAWFPPAVRDALLGEVHWLKLPSAEQLDGPPRGPRTPAPFTPPVRGAAPAPPPQ